MTKLLILKMFKIFVNITYLNIFYLKLNYNQIQIKKKSSLGDHPLMQNIFRELQNYRSVGNVGACRACTIIPSEYHKYTVCSKARNFLKVSYFLLIYNTPNTLKF